MTQSFNEIQEHLVQATHEMFESFGVELAPRTGGGWASTRPSGTSDATVAAVMGFGGDVARGALVIMTSPEVVTTIQPEDLRAELMGKADATCDTLSEAANLLLGRVKNRLLSRGLVLVLSAPTAAIGREIQIARSDGFVAWHCFESTAGPLFIHFNAVFDAAFEIGADTETHSAFIEEGGMMMF